MTASTTVSSIIPTTVAPVARMGLLEKLTSEITKEDLISIYVSDRKNELDEQHNTVKARSTELDAELQKLSTKLETFGPKATRSVVTTHHIRAAKALEEAGFGKYKIEVAEGSRDDKRQVYAVQVNLIKVKSSTGYSSYDTTTATDTVEVPFPKEVIDILDRLGDLRLRINAVHNELVAIKVKKQNLPEQEREARAHFARLAVSRDQDGADLLEQMKNIKALPLLV